MKSEAKFGYTKNGYLWKDNQDKLYLDAENAKILLDRLNNSKYKSKIKRVKTASNDLIIDYGKEVLRIMNYQYLYQNHPIFRDYIYSALTYQKVTKKVKRKNKYIGIAIALSSAVLASLMIKSSIKKPTSETIEEDPEFILENPDKAYDEFDKKYVYELNNKEKASIATLSNSDTPIEAKENLEEESKTLGDNFNDVQITTSFVSKSGTDRALSSINYYDQITSLANKYLLDPELVLAIATQERGTHSNIMDEGGGLGLMQIQVSAHPDGSTLPVYQKNANGEITKTSFTFNLANYQTLEGNIEAGCALLQYYMNYYDGNLVAAVSAYNGGQGTVNKAINAYANEINKTYEEVVNNKGNTDWLKYLINKSYIENIYSWLRTNEINLFQVKENNDGLYDIETYLYGIINTNELETSHNLA